MARSVSSIPQEISKTKTLLAYLCCWHQTNPFPWPDLPHHLHIPPSLVPLPPHSTFLLLCWHICSRMASSPVTCIWRIWLSCQHSDSTLKHVCTTGRKCFPPVWRVHWIGLLNSWNNMDTCIQGSLAVSKRKDQIKSEKLFVDKKSLIYPFKEIHSKWFILTFKSP